MKTKSSAFTLAELLVVIGLIGVVATMTIPNLANNSGNQKNTLRLQKTYQTLNEAYGRASAKYGPMSTWFTSDMDETAKQDKIAARFKEFLSVQRDCGTGNGCYPDEKTKTSKGLVLDDVIAKTTHPKMLLASGVAIDFYVQPKEKGDSILEESDIFMGELILGQVRVGTSGINETPIYGRNLFIFTLTDTGVRPNGLNDVTKCFSSPDSCAAWVIKYGNMDYLDAGDDGVCKNGTQLSKSMTTCH